MHGTWLDNVLITEQVRVGPIEKDCCPRVFEFSSDLIEPGKSIYGAAEPELIEESKYEYGSSEAIGEFFVSHGGTD